MLTYYSQNYVGIIYLPLLAVTQFSIIDIVVYCIWYHTDIAMFLVVTLWFELCTTLLDEGYTLGLPINYIGS